MNAFPKTARALVVKFALLVGAVASAALAGSQPARAVSIQEVTTEKGIKVWLVEDHKLPLIALHFAFRGGVEQDPAEKQGLANLTMELLTEGAGPYDADAFQQALANASIALGFEASRDALLGSLKTLKQDREKAFALLRLALTRPRLEKAAVERLRGQQLAQLRVQFGNPDWQARYGLFQHLFGAHPYGERRLGTVETLAHITRE
ncbi:MAG: insulinase family protein, partial [Pseudomonadota bacterium]|nr:insulinase family protein [Pseudomonadota bacterium]